MTKRFHVNWYLAAALLLAVAAALPLLSLNGFLNTRGGGDSPFLLQRVHQLVTALQDGHFPVRWMPDANYGFGYPFFNFYAPLSIYIAAVFQLLGFPITHSIQAAQLLGFVVAAWGMFVLARHWFENQWAALVPSVAYSFAPFHMVNVYVRGGLVSGFWAMAWYPWLLVSADALINAKPGRRLRALVAFSLIFALLIVTHNISALIFVPFLGLYIVISLFVTHRNRQQHDRKTPFWILVLMALGAGVLGLALSAWFWLPALVEQSLAQLGPVTEGYFHFSQHFRNLGELVQRSLTFDYDVADGGAFRMGLVQAVLIGIGVVGLLITMRRSYRTAFIFATLILTTFLILPASNWLWETVPLLAFTQFPWRFLSVQAFAGALATAGVVLLGSRLDNHGCAVFGSLAMTVLIIAAFGTLRTEFIAIRDADVTAERLMEYEWFTGNIGTTISAEYLPSTVQPRTFTSVRLDPERHDPGYPATILSGEARGMPFHIDLMQTQRQVWQIDVASAEATIMLPTVYWPGWEARSDGRSIPLTAAAGSGQMQLTLPQGGHVVELRLTRTAPRLIGEWISLLALILVVVLVVVLWRKAGFDWRRVVRWSVVALVVVMLLLLIGNRLQSSQFYTGIETRSWNFDEEAYLHHNPGGIAIGGARLLLYEMPERVKAGATLEATLEWVAGTGEATLSLVTPADYRYDNVPVIAESAEPITIGPVTYELPIPANAPPGLYLPRLTVGDDVEYLRPVRVVAVEQAAQTAQIPFAARVTDVAGEENGDLRVQMAWRTAQSLSENYIAVIRLLDSRNLFYAQHDAQPGYGFLPTTTWSAGEWVDDWVNLAWVTDDDGNVLDDGIGPYVLTASLYSADTGDFIFTRRLGEIDWRSGTLQFTPTEPQFELSPGVELIDATFGDVFALRGYELTQDSEQLNAVLFWEALAVDSADYIHFVHLVDENGAVIAQHDAMPRYDTYPTSQWSPGEIVSDPATIALIDVPQGTYQLIAGFYRDLGNGQFPRLPVRGGDAFSADAVLLLEVEIP